MHELHFRSFVLILSLLLCSGGQLTAADENLEKFLAAPPGWTAGELAGRYTAENLHEYLNGGAERYLGYGFREAAVREYVGPGGKGKVMVELYRMDSPANAFGIYSSDRAAGDEIPNLGQGAVLNPYLLQFWQGRCFARLQDIDVSGALRDSLLAFGRLIARSLPQGSAGDIPAITRKMGLKGLAERSLCYFHSQNSLNSFIYLGEDNLLGLGHPVEAVTAEYRTGEADSFGRLVLIRYPGEQACRAAFERFSGARGKIPQSAASVLSHAEARGEYILLAFKTADKGWSGKAAAALWKALEKQN